MDVPPRNKGHGRIEKRNGWVLDLTDHPNEARLPHRTVAFRIERERRNAKTGKAEHGLTSLPLEQATAELVLALVRGHWSIQTDSPARLIYFLACVQ